MTVLIGLLAIGLPNLLLTARTARSVAALLTRADQRYQDVEDRLRTRLVYSSRPAQIGDRDARHRTPRRSRDVSVRAASYPRAVGYEVHISRHTNWWDGGGGQITQDEFEAVVRADPELVRVALPESYRWGPQWIAALATGSDSMYGREGMRWCAGRIVARCPSDAFIAKMRQVAKALDARVQGDDGEYYDD